MLPSRYPPPPRPSRPAIRIFRVAIHLAALLLPCAAIAAAAGPTNPPAPLPEVASGRIERLTGLDFGTLPERPVDVWLPGDLLPGQRLAVVYMHDGQMLFDAAQTWNGQEWRVDEVAGTLVNAGQTRPFMVVAVHNGGAHRHAEYFPQQAFERLAAADRARIVAAQRGSGQRLFSTAPHADDYLSFIVERLKPEIDRRYPTLSDPDNTVVMGSSMGGLISLYALARHPDVFGAAGCLSTHWPGGFDPDDRTLSDALFALFADILPQAGRHRLYFDYGDATLDALYPPLQRRVDALLREKGYAKTDWTTRFFPGAEHSEQAWAARLDQPLKFLLPPLTQ